MTTTDYAAIDLDALAKLIKSRGWDGQLPKVEIEKLVAVIIEIQAHVVVLEGTIEELTHGLPELLKNIGYEDEENLIEKACTVLFATPRYALYKTKEEEQ